MTDDAVNAFLAQGPPRHLTPEMRRVFRRRGSWMPGLLFGFFLIFGSLFVWIFTPWHCLTTRSIHKGPSDRVTGAILTQERTNSRNNGSTVYSYRFSYPLKSGGQQEGTAYTSGQLWSAGAPVTVLRLRADERRALPLGARLDEFSAGALFVWIFPTIGLVGLIFTLRGNGRATRRLLETGEYASATVDSLEPMNLTVNRVQTHRGVITRTDTGVSTPFRAYDQETIDWLKERIRQRQPVAILQDRMNPKRFIFPDTFLSDGRGGSA